MLANKVAVITGAGSGIGRSTAYLFAENRSKVVLIDNNKEEVDTLQSELETEGMAIEADVSSSIQMHSALKEAARTFGKVDIVFANAGINGAVAPIEDFDPDEWDKTLSVNMKGTFLTVKHAIPYMKQGGGSIIITSSVNGNRVFSNFGMTAYSASKAGQMAFGKMAALELSNYNIRVNVICPGAIDTNIGDRTYPDEEQLKNIRIPTGKKVSPNNTGTPEQVAETVLFLASDASSHVSGTEMYIDGSQTLL
ncbi:SDR family oxidoreductase [Geomicrobium halophilum]|nr:SDR family NAD(P)-dependent oxidoreductase [Geomicrobium halophilum]